MHEWQPIETAPKDRPVLVHPGLWAGRTCSIATWNDDKYAKKPRPFWERDDDMGRITYSRNAPPTHWMPLPPPPRRSHDPIPHRSSGGHSDG